MSTKGFLIAAPQSGSGKTTVALAIMSALNRRGLKVAPFKCGPDFIDPGYHRLVTGRPSINLDGWMCPESFVADTFMRHTIGADVAIIEGAMGLFDGLGSSSKEGSSAQVAAITAAPVVLVVNVRGMAASAVALVKGFAEYDPRIRLAGVIFNNVGSEKHAELLRQALADALPQVGMFGFIPREEELLIPSRHLGLVTAEDNPLPAEYLNHLSELAEQYLDLEGLAGLRIESKEISSGSSPTSRPGVAEPVLIAVARDAAFCFIYEDNLRLLKEAGADLIFFSPLDDLDLPAGISGIYLPGGYPELHAERLTANLGLRTAILEAVTKDMPCYAECGGMIYLTQGMETADSEPAMNFAGVFPVRARMLPRRKALGYRQVQFLTDSISGVAGMTLRGHEFHYSEIGMMPLQVKRCYRVTRPGEKLGLEGYRLHKCLASYIHLHFGSAPRFASAFVESCRKYKAGEGI
ncbi:MAG TPA: cobyrinate a,c-diamide synthase [Desulfuromonadaceae bacterium]|jgi:cobyrinic acid a,c-diamide synthase